MNQENISLVLASALVAWAIYAEKRIQSLSSKLVVSEEGKKDAEIQAAVHELSDDDLAAKMSDYLGDSKPKS